MDLRRKLFSGAILNGVSFAVSSSIVLSWYFITAKFLSTDQSAKILLSIAFAGILNIADFGYGTFLYKISSELRQKAYENHIIRLWIAILSQLVIHAFFSVLVIYIVVTFLDYDFTHIDVSFAVFFALTSEVMVLILSFLKGRLLFKSAGKIAFCHTVLIYLSSMICIIYIPDLSLFCMATSSAIMPLWFLCKEYTSAYKAVMFIKRNGVQLNKVYLCARLSLEFFPQAFVGIIFMHAQRFLVGQFVGQQYIASTALCYSISTRIHALINSFCEVVFPHAKDILLRNDCRKIVMSMIGFISIAFVFLGAIAFVLYYQLFSKSFYPLILFLFGAFISAIWLPVYHILNCINRHGLISSIMLFGAFVNVILFFLFAESNNEVAFPLAYLCSQVMVLMLVSIICSLLIRFKGPHNGIA